MIKKIADIVVYAPDSSPQLVVEVKNRSGASADWAARMLRNLLVHGMILDAPYYMLALPDVFYLWKNVAREGGEPDFEIDATEALASYVDEQSFSPDAISEYGLELLVSSWLTDLVEPKSREEISPRLFWLFDSGLYDAIKGGRVATEVAA